MVRWLPYTFKALFKSVTYEMLHVALEGKWPVGSFILPNIQLKWPLAFISLLIKCPRCLLYLNHNSVTYTAFCMLHSMKHNDHKRKSRKAISNYGVKDSIVWDLLPVHQSLVSSILYWYSHSQLVWLQTATITQHSRESIQKWFPDSKEQRWTSQGKWWSAAATDWGIVSPIILKFS